MKTLPLLFCSIIFTSSYLCGQEDPLIKSIERGKLIYYESCITCHLGKGEGITGTFPPLSKADYLIKTPEKAIQAIKYGLNGKIEVNGIAYNAMMPNPGLSNDEIADVMNYIRNSWGNVNPKLITEKMVEVIRK